MGNGADDAFERYFPKRAKRRTADVPSRTSLVPRVRRSMALAEKQEALEKLIRNIMESDSNGLVIDSGTSWRLLEFFDSLYLDAEGELIFRHQYAGISGILYTEISEAESDGLLVEAPQSFSNLTNGLDQIMSAMRRERTRLRQEELLRSREKGVPELFIDEDGPDVERVDSILGSLGKLDDHISLEMERIDYIIRQNRASEEARGSVERAVAERKEELEGFDQKLNETQEKVSRDNIGVLGVFAAIVLAFNGGISFSTSSLQAIGDGRGVLTVLLTVDVAGFVLLNAIGLLLFFVWRVSLGKTGDLGRFPKAVWMVVDLLLVAFAALIVWCPSLFSPLV